MKIRQNRFEVALGPEFINVLPHHGQRLELRSERSRSFLGCFLARHPRHISTLDVGRGLFLERPADAFLALSPDGNTLAYTVYDGMASQAGQEIHVRRMNELGVNRLPGTASAKNPFFSPDGQWLGYFTFPGDGLYKVSLEGGAPVRIAPARFFWGASWGIDDYIYFTAGGVVYRVPASAGEREIVLEPGLQVPLPGIVFPRSSRRATRSS